METNSRINKINSALTCFIIYPKQIKLASWLLELTLINFIPSRNTVFPAKGTSILFSLKHCFSLCFVFSFRLSILFNLIFSLIHFAFILAHITVITLLDKDIVGDLSQAIYKEPNGWNIHYLIFNFILKC